MSEKTRNIAVGITVLVALMLLGVMILIFTGLPSILKRGYVVKMRFDVTYDLSSGDPVYLAGIRAGMIKDVDFTDPADPSKGVTFTALIDPHISLPGNIRPVVFTKGLVGKGYLELVAEGPKPVDPRTGAVLEYLPKDGSVVLMGEHRGNGIFPAELNTALKGLAKLADNLNELLAPTAPPAPPGVIPTQPATGQAPQLPGLRGTLEKFNRTLDALYAVVGNAENQANIKASLAGLTNAAAKTAEAMEAFKAFAEEARTTVAEVGEAASATSTQIDALSAKLIEDAEAISGLMATMQATVAKIDSGQGTAGHLLNDPALYNNLVDATRQMTDLLREFRQLVQTWQKSGVQLKVK
jgi:phospholipid/cholesterol/gamma-HCH transport system substrate-binding protein